MKRLYGILILAMLAVCSVAVVSCGDDDEPKIASEKDGGSKNSSKESALIGTWLASGNDWYTQVVFKSNKKFQWDDYEDGEYEYYYGTWSLSGSTVELEFDDGDSDEMTFDGKNLYYNGDKFTKQ